MTISRRDFMKASGAALGMGALGWGCQPFHRHSAHAGPFSGRRPNILCIFTDESAPHYVGAYGGDFLTPNIDSLAREGRRFDEAYCVSPACVPTRYSVLSGQYAGRCRHPMFVNSQPPDERYMLGWNTPLTADTATTARVLGGAGYYTGFVGKWHNWWDPAIDTSTWPGFERDADPDDPEVDRKLRELQQHLVDAVCATSGFENAASVVDGNHSRVPQALSHHHFEWLTRGALDLLEDAAQQDRPFYLHVATTAVHGPDHADNLERDPRYTYGGKMERHLDAVPPRHTLAERLRKAGLPVDSDHVGMLQNDDLVGALVKRLDELGLADNTMVLYMADHGVEPGKGTVYQQGVRVPLLVRWPGAIPAGTASRERVQFVDMLPTFADAAGAPLPAGHTIDGLSFLPNATTGAPLCRDALYLEMLLFRGLLKGRYKYIAFRFRDEDLRQMREGEVEVALGAAGRTRHLFSDLGIRYFPAYYDQDQLYDVVDDPWEQNNLAGDPQYAGILAELKADLRRALDTLRHPYSLERIPYMDSSEFRQLVEARTARAKNRRWWKPDFEWPETKG